MATKNFSGVTGSVEFDKTGGVTENTSRSVEENLRKAIALRRSRQASARNGTRAVTTEAPQWRYRQRGGIQDEAKSATSIDDTDALFAVEVQSFSQGTSASLYTFISSLKIGSPLPSAPGLRIRKFESCRPSQAV